jgi:hypothetical protein
MSIEYHSRLRLVCAASSKITSSNSYVPWSTSARTVAQRLRSLALSSGVLPSGDWTVQMRPIIVPQTATISSA